MQPSTLATLQPSAAQRVSLNQLKIARLLETLATAVEAVSSIDESLGSTALRAVDPLQSETLSIIHRQRAALEADIRAIRAQLRALGAPTASDSPASPRTGGVQQEVAASGRPDPGSNAPSQDAPPPSVGPLPSMSSTSSTSSTRAKSAAGAEQPLTPNPLLPSAPAAPPRAPTLCGFASDDDDDRHQDYRLEAQP